MDDLVAVNPEDMAYLQQIFSEMNTAELMDLLRTRPRRSFESVVEYAERLQRVQARWENQEERVERLKAFWSKVFFSGNNESNQDKQ